ncbi:MAG: GNAT family N-acetyltransferase, partial [Rhodothermales bacterium]|nr:GNAT family N-acetyltransferase [Rhodothermales bacterium]
MPSEDATRAVIVRAATDDDLDALERLESESFESDRISRRSFRRFMDSSAARMLVAVEPSNRVVGYALVSVRRNSRRARLYSIAVEARSRGAGIGTLLLGSAETVALASHCNELSLEVRRTREEVISLYERVGFVKTADLPGYYEDGGDGIRMVKALGAGRSTALPVRSRVPLVIVDRRKDLPFEPAVGRVLTTREYLGLGHGVPGRTVVNLSRSYEPLAKGYYCSLLAEARGERCFPGPDSILDINWKRLHRSAFSDVEPLLKAAGSPVPTHLDVMFGQTEDARFSDVGALVFDLFRCPVIRLSISDSNGAGPRITEIEALSVPELDETERERFRRVLDGFLRKRAPMEKALPRAASSIAVLIDPHEEIPPSDAAALANFEAAALDLGARLTFITRKDLNRLSQFDALFIRETTSLDHHTYRFARKAEREGMPVIDSPGAILKCTNKIFLYELLRTHRIPTPPTRAFDARELPAVAAEIDYPVVLKIPDGCFSQGVIRVDSADELASRARTMFDDSDLLLVQSYMPT